MRVINNSIIKEKDYEFHEKSRRLKVAITNKNPLLIETKEKKKKNKKGGKVKDPLKTKKDNSNKEKDS